MSLPPSLDDIDALAKLYPHSPKHFHVVRPQIEQRSQLVKTWGIQPGERVLEIGCGQGDCTLVLAAAVGENGSVTAIDPASLDYGSPFTLGQAQAHLRTSSLGSRMTFVQADPIGFLRNTTERYTTAVMAQCIWYFASPQVFADIMAALRSRVDRICISEYSLVASDYRAFPHVLATFAQASLECRKQTSNSNVRTVMSPERLKESIKAAGLTVRDETILRVPDGMLDGTWEVNWVLSPAFLEEVGGAVQDEKEKSVVFAARDSVLGAKRMLEERGERVGTMDVWVATVVFE
ncbi:S-adenosyl-L-methionine-dependent methyltransferase [Cubamyces sp. BRFM 1775]|nr:S-adenosyl-L-methionine-dependent methyltransferase [Cubamyces sp. BRFM 1775]